MNSLSLALVLVLGSWAWGQAKPLGNQSFHHCTLVGGSGNSPHLFDASDIYQCDEGTVEIAGRRTMTIEHGYVYEQELGKQSCDRPHLATKSDYEDYKWCPDPKSWDKNQKEMCGDKPTQCFDGRPGTWDPEWQGYSCVTSDHGSNGTTSITGPALHIEGGGEGLIEPDGYPQPIGPFGTKLSNMTITESEPMDVPAIHTNPEIVRAQTNSQFTIFPSNQGGCVLPPDGDLSHWICVDGASLRHS